MPRGFACDEIVTDRFGRRMAHPVAVAVNRRLAHDQEPGKRMDAAEAFQAFKNLLGHLDPDELDRFLKLCQDYGYSAAESDEPTTAGGGTVDPYREGEDRRRLAHDAALSSAERAFARRFRNAGRISVIF